MVSIVQDVIREQNAESQFVVTDKTAQGRHRKACSTALADTIRTSCWPSWAPVCSQIITDWNTWIAHVWKEIKKLYLEWMKGDPTWKQNKSFLHNPHFQTASVLEGFHQTGSTEQAPVSHYASDLNFFIPT